MLLLWRQLLPRPPPPRTMSPRMQLLRRPQAILGATWPRKTPGRPAKFRSSCWWWMHAMPPAWGLGDGSVRVWACDMAYVLMSRTTHACGDTQPALTPVSNPVAVPVSVPTPCLLPCLFRCQLHDCLHVILSLAPNNCPQCLPLMPAPQCLPPCLSHACSLSVPMFSMSLTSSV